MLVFLLLFARHYPRRRLAGVLRVAVFLTFAGTVVSLFAARHARADLASAALRIGKDLLPLSRELGGASTVSINGQRMQIRYDGGERTVRETLDAAEAACRNGGVRETAPRPTDAKVDADAFLRLADLGVVRDGNDREGVVLCFAPGELSRPTLAGQLEALAQTNDLGSLGRMRYVYARQDGARTAVMIATTEDSFRLDAFQPDRDADVGQDDPALPRPKGSVRFLDAKIEASPYGLQGYRTHLPDDEVRTAFDADMTARGFAVVELPEASVLGLGRKSRLYQKDGVIVSFGVFDDTTSGRMVAIGTLGADDHRISEVAR